jgi:chromosome segregation ATPase
MVEELESLKTQIEQESEKGAELDHSFKLMESEYNQIFKRLKSHTDKHNNLRTAMDKLVKEKSHLEEERKVKGEEISCIEKKMESMKFRAIELEDAHQKLSQEIKIKNNEMTKIRKENSEIESKLKHLKNIQDELAKILELKNKLALENEIMCHQLKCVEPNCDLSKYSYKISLKSEESSFTHVSQNRSSLDEQRAELLNKIRLESTPNLLVFDPKVKIDPKDDLQGGESVSKPRLIEDMNTLKSEIDMKKTKESKHLLDLEYLNKEMEDKDRNLKEKDENVGRLYNQIEFLSKQIDSISNEKDKLARDYQQIQQKATKLTNLYSNVAAPASLMKALSQGYESHLENSVHEKVRRPPLQE